MAKPHILIIDGHELYREALSLLLSRLMPRKVVIQMSEPGDSFALDAASINLVLLNLKAPYMEGLARLRILRQRLVATPVILLSEIMDTKVARMARALGANAFVYASITPEDLAATINEVLSGKLIYPEELMITRNADFQLSPRQLEVLDLLCKGMTNKEIGTRLDIGDNTVRTHVAAIFDILEVRNRTEAAMLGKQLFL